MNSLFFFFLNSVMPLKDAADMANSIDPDQTHGGESRDILYLIYYLYSDGRVWKIDYCYFNT